MNKYDLIVHSLCEAVSCGDITEEFAESVNDLAYYKYVVEEDISSSDKSKEEKRKKRRKIIKIINRILASIAVILLILYRYKNKIDEINKTHEKKLELIRKIHKMEDDIYTEINALEKEVKNDKYDKEILKLDIRFGNFLTGTVNKIENVSDKDFNQKFVDSLISDIQNEANNYRNMIKSFQ